MTPALLFRRCCLAVLTGIILFPTLLSAQADEKLTVKVRDMADNMRIVGASVSLFDEDNMLVGNKTTDESGEVAFEFNSSSVSNVGHLGTRLGNPGPNPFSTSTTLPLSLKRSGVVEIALFDILGRPVARAERYLGVGEHGVNLNLGALEAGRYLVRVVAGEELIGSSGLQYFGAGEGEPEIRVTGSGVFSADKGAVPGTFRLEISHPDYRTYEQKDITISGKSVQFAMMQFVEFVAEFGKGRPDFTIIADARSGLDVPRDLEFNPEGENELWVVNRAFDGTVTYYNAGTESMSAFRVQDIYGNHFMEEVSAIAFGVDGFFGTAQESINTYNGQGAGNNFMGPALWDSDTSIYSKSTGEGWGDLGAHMDMLHESPNGMGIAHASGNAYWYADGYYNNIVYYDFQQDHGPGWDDHSDGIVRRYMDAVIARYPNVPGHMILDKATGWLYIADPGNRRVTRLNTTTGSATAPGNLDGSQLEPLQEYTRYTGATYEVFVDEDLTRPCGIALHENRIFVSDNSTGDIVAFDMEGNELNRISTPASSIMGVEIGPDGKIWYVDASNNQVVRVDPASDD